MIKIVSGLSGLLLSMMVLHAQDSQVLLRLSTNGVILAPANFIAANAVALSAAVGGGTNGVSLTTATNIATNAIISFRGPFTGNGSGLTNISGATGIQTGTMGTNVFTPSAIASLQSTNGANGVALTTVISIHGDSITEMPLAGVGRTNWPYQMTNISQIFNAATVYNFAYGGTVAGDCINEFNGTSTLNHNPTYSNYHGGLAVYSTNWNAKNYCFIWKGVNDIGQGDNATHIYSTLTNVWSAARNAGYTVIAFTIGPVSSYTVGGTNYTTWTNLNAKICSDTSLYDYLIRPELVNPNAADGTYYIDGIHLNPLGSSRLAKAIADALEGKKSIISMTRSNGITDSLLSLNGGNVGIGTVNPYYKLDVFGDGNISSNLTVGGVLTGNGYGITNLNLSLYGSNAYTDQQITSLSNNLSGRISSSNSVTTNIVTGPTTTNLFQVYSNNTPAFIVANNGRVTIQVDNVGHPAPTNGYQLINTTPATASQQQAAPPFDMVGSGWSTSSGGTNQEVRFRWATSIVTNGATPAVALLLTKSIGGGAFSQIARFEQNALSFGNTTLGMLYPVTDNGDSDIGGWNLRFRDGFFGRGVTMSNLYLMQTNAPTSYTAPGTNGQIIVTPAAWFFYSTNGTSRWYSNTMNQATF